VFELKGLMKTVDMVKDQRDQGAD